MSLRGDVLHSLKWLAGARFAGQLVAWAITLVVIRILHPSDYGLMAMAELMMGFAVLFQEMGLYTAMVQKRDLTSRQIEQSFGLLIIANSAIYALVFALAPLFASFFGDPRLTNIVRVLGIQFPLASVGVVQDAMLSRSMNFKRKSFVTLAVVLGNGFTTLTFALSGAGVWALVYGSLVGSLIRPIGLTIAAQHWCRPRFSRAGMTDMLRFGGFVTVSRLIWYVYSQADVFIIGKILGKEILGYYSIALQLASLPMQKVSDLLSQVGLAAYSSVQQDMGVVRSHFRKAIRILSFISFPIFWGISSISPDLVAVVLGSRWQPAVVPLQLLSLLMPLRMVSHSGSGALEAIGKPQIGTGNLLVALIVMPPAFFIGAYYGGLTGVCIAWLVAYPIVRIIQLRSALPPFGMTIPKYFSSMGGPALGGAVMYLTVIAAREKIAEPLLSPAFGLIFLICVGVLVYAAFMWFVRREDCREMIALTRKQR